MPTRETVTLTVSIDAPFPAVVATLADPAAHPGWATEFFAGPAEPLGDGLYRVDVPMMGGPTDFRIDAVAELGVIDLHLAPVGASFGDALPVRVIPNGSGADVLWTLSRPTGIPDPAWHAGLDAMRRELSNLKTTLEAA